MSETLTATPVQLKIALGELSKIWDATNHSLQASTNENTPTITDGNLYVGYDSSKQRAMLFTDIGNLRYKFITDIDWADITGTENIATLQDLADIETTIGEGYLKKADGGEIAKDLMIGKSITLNAEAGSITAKNLKLTNLSAASSATKFLVNDSNGNVKTLTAANMKKSLSLDKVNNTSDSEKPVSTLQQKAIDAVASNVNTTLATAQTANDKTYFSTLETDTSSTNTFKLSTPATVEKGGKVQTWTAENTYPTQLVWDTQQSATEMKGVLKMCINGAGTTDVPVDAIPAATKTTYGIISNKTQTFGGLKNFDDGIQLTNKLTLIYNDQTDSLDFTFL